MYFWSHLAQFFLEWKMYHPKLVEKNKTHFTFSRAPPPTKIVPFVWCGKNLYHRTGRQWQYGYTHTHTHTHTEYVLFIAFPWQQWLCERASMLRFMHIACLALVQSQTFLTSWCRTCVMTRDDFHLMFCVILSMMATGSVHLRAFLAVVHTCHGCRAPFRIDI